MIFSAIAGAIFGAGTFLATAAATVMSLGASIGLSYLSKALSGNKAEASKADTFSVQGRLTAGGIVPRAFNLGYSATAGSLVYQNEWGYEGETPNAYSTRVISLADLPGGALREVWVNGELCTLGPSPHPEFGYPVTQYNKDGKDHLWIKHWGGDQTIADPFLCTRVSSTARPYESTRVGYGVSYVICTALVNEKLFTGFPDYKFATSGIPLYDPSKDSSVGGSGSHRYSNPATWGGDGDDLPAVQIYNLLRGIRYNGTWLYGLQAMTAARLPVSNWIAQINKCRAQITGTDGLEPTYRSGGQINVDAQIANAVEALLAACQGRVSEIGGFYKIHVGEPDSPTFAWTDADLLSSEEQTYRPFFALADSVNGVQATYPDPAQGWATATAPAYYRTDLEAIDGGRRLMANPALDFVPYAAQVQRLQKASVLEAQRARTHVLPFPPAFWLVEPGDIGQWTSTRNGYSDKLFRVDGAVDHANLDVTLSVTEVDPSDYSWTHSTDFQNVTIGTTFFPRPEPQGIVDWYAEGAVISDAEGFTRRPAIRLSWYGDMPGVSGVSYQVRMADDHTVIYRGSVTAGFEIGSVLIGQNLLPNTDYEAQGQYIPSAPRDVLPSDWLPVTTPDARMGLLDFQNAVVRQVTEVFDYKVTELREALNLLSSIVKEVSGTTWSDKREVRSQISSTFESSLASIENVKSAYTAADAALASDITTVAASVAGNTASIITNATAISNLSTSFGSFQTTVSAQFGSLNATVATNASAIATLNGYAAAAYSTTLDVNHYIVGTQLVNGGPGVSAFIVTADKFQVAAPGVGGGTPVPIFTVANVNDVPKIAIRADMYADGSIYARHIAAGTFSALWAEIDYLVSGKIVSPDGKMVSDYRNSRTEIYD